MATRLAGREEKIGGVRTVRALSFWHNVTSTALKQLPMDLSSRQQAILLTVYLIPGPHSIKALAEELMISKPAVCRAVDALEKAKLVRRLRDRADKRNVLIQRTAKGSTYLTEFAGIILDMTKEAA